MVKILYQLNDISPSNPLQLLCQSLSKCHKVIHKKVDVFHYFLYFYLDLGYIIGALNTSRFLLHPYLLPDYQMCAWVTCGYVSICMVCVSDCLYSGTPGLTRIGWSQMQDPMYSNEWFVSVWRKCHSVLHNVACCQVNTIVSIWNVTFQHVYSTMHWIIEEYFTQLYAIACHQCTTSWLMCDHV